MPVAANKGLLHTNGPYRFNFHSPNHFLSHIGVVPANGEVGIEVVFSPTEFCTAIMELKVSESSYKLVKDVL